MTSLAEDRTFRSRLLAGIGPFLLGFLLAALALCGAARAETGEVRITQPYWLLDLPPRHADAVADTKDLMRGVFSVD